MFGWCSRTGTFVELPTPDGFVCMLLQIVPRGPAWSKGGPHDSAVLHGVRSARVEHRLVLEPTILCLHAGGCIRHGDHPAFSISVAIIFIVNIIATFHIFHAEENDILRFRGTRRLELSQIWCQCYFVIK